MVIRFTDSRFDSQRTNAEIQRRLPGAREVTARVMTLRVIAVALAKSAKTGKGAR